MPRGESTATFRSRTCPVCGKKFCIPYQGEWAYRTKQDGHVVWCCSWTCLVKKQGEKKNRRAYVPSLRETRIKYGMSSTDVASMLGVSEKTYGLYELCTSTMSTEMIEKAAVILGARAKDLTKQPEFMPETLKHVSHPRSGTVFVARETAGKIKEARLKQGYTQEALAEAAKVSKTTVYIVETGNKKVQIDNLNAVLDILGLKHAEEAYNEDDDCIFLKKSVGTDIRDMRMKQNRTQSYVARTANISQSTLWRMEQGSVRTTVGTLRAVMKAIGNDPEVIIEKVRKNG